MKAEHGVIDVPVRNAKDCGPPPEARASSHPGCGHLLGRPQETNTDYNLISFHLDLTQSQTPYT